MTTKKKTLEIGKTYKVKDVFLTLQGEGLRAGTRAVFVRFAGCNMWSGIPRTRSKGDGACAMWCDTDFTADGAMTRTAVQIADMCLEKWGDGRYSMWVVLTGGEPLLQVDEPLLDHLAAGCGYNIAMETNGSIPIDHRMRCMIDHLCVSPKLGKDRDCGAAIKRLKVFGAEELKVVYPGVHTGVGWTEEALDALAMAGDWNSLVIQPQDPIDPKAVEISYLRGDDVSKVNPFMQDQFLRNMDRCVEWVMKRPEWRLGTQLHKMLRLP